MNKEKALISPIQKYFLRPLILLIFLNLTGYQAILQAQAVQEIKADEFYSPQLLNSERIKMKFGRYGIDVLKASPELRISNLHSLNKGQKTTRTFAVVQYPKTVNKAYSKEHQIIVDGGSIGQVFKEANWKITKRNLFFGTLPASSLYQKVYDLMGLKTPNELAIRIYQFQISKNDLSYSYATISEIHHPAYLNFNDLTKINREAKKYTSKAQVKDLLQFLPRTIEELEQ